MFTALNCAASSLVCTLLHTVLLHAAFTAQSFATHCCSCRHLCCELTRLHTALHRFAAQFLYCTIAIQLHYYTTRRSYYHNGMPLCDYTNIRLDYYTNRLRYCYTATLLNECTTIVLHYCTTILRYDDTNILLYHEIDIRQDYDTTTR